MNFELGMPFVNPGVMGSVRSANAMISSCSDSPESVCIRFARNCFTLLAHGAFPEAIRLLDEPNSYGLEWSPERIKAVIEEYSGSTTATFSDPETLLGDGRPCLYVFDDGRGFALDHDVPLDGEWSDLTAQFEFLHRPDGYAVVLQDLHVL